ncbi:hypothetical protein RR46_10884 [Papilio xuthus]|uniref:Uncharacterized protein n=1 Tax=Papilio xuthus TaxID=66420 RepID=A0A194PLL6_PAPXU|nr:hypothetical protein RR46_10884 [Papilio xuthus]
MVFFTDAGGLCLNKGCCGPKANVALTQRAHQQLTDSLRSELAKLADILSVRARKFDDLVIGLMLNIDIPIGGRKPAKLLPRTKPDHKIKLPSPKLKKGEPSDRRPVPILTPPLSILPSPERRSIPE